MRWVIRRLFGFHDGGVLKGQHVTPKGIHVSPCGFSMQHSSNQQAFDRLTEGLFITVPYCALVKGFIVYDGETVADGVLRAAREATGCDDVSIHTESNP